MKQVPLSRQLYAGARPAGHPMNGSPVRTSRCLYPRVTAALGENLHSTVLAVSCVFMTDKSLITSCVY